VKKSFYWIFAICLLIGSVSVFATNKNQSLAQKMLKPVIEQGCKSELNASKVWQSAAFFMSTERQNSAQKQICGCVGEYALQDISAKELAMASMSESAKNSLIKQAVMNSVKGCAQDALK
jgi:AMMECR1 domain-containing protein